MTLLAFPHNHIPLPSSIIPILFSRRELVLVASSLSTMRGITLFLLAALAAASEARSHGA